MRILGIDIGTTSVKAVELDAGFGRFEIHEYHELKIEEGRNPNDAARSLILALPQAPDRVITAIRTNRVTFRNLQLPTRDKKAIQASIGFELDDDLPFSLEDAAYDYTVLSQVGPQTQVHVAATLRKNIELQIAQLNASDIDPEVITTETWAYRTLLNRIVPPTAQENPIILIQMGASHTTLYAHWKGFPVMARELAWGGNDLTLAISKKYGITTEAAEKAKLDNGFVLAPSQHAQATPEQEEFSNALHETLLDLLREIRQANLVCKNITSNKISSIYLAGGTALLPGLAGMLAEELQISVHPVHALSRIATSGVTYSEHTDAAFALAVANALCVVGAERSTSINLRKGDLAKKGTSSELSLGSLKRPLQGLAIVASLMLLSLVVQNQIYTTRLQETDKQLEKSVKSFFGQVSGSALRTYMSNTSSLRSSVTKELNKQKTISKLVGPNQMSPLNYLQELSRTIPQDVVLDMMHYQVGAAPTATYAIPGEKSVEKTANLSFLVSNPQMAEKLATLTATKMNAMQRSKIEEVPAADGSKRWKITFTGITPDEAYGASYGK
ncbi:MAG: pilus assembly protein PilM [Methylotenera sp.]|nr:pilus assembly protein PilM [Oligoflexia bacterium]